MRTANSDRGTAEGAERPMIDFGRVRNYYVAYGYTDIRKQRKGDAYGLFEP